MSGGASSSEGSPAWLDVSNAKAIDFENAPIFETLPCFVEGRVGTPQTVNLARVRLPSGEAVSAFTSNIHLMGEKLQPFMDFALGEGAEVSDRFRFRDIGVQVAGSEQVGSSYHRCLAACKEMTRLVLLANFKSLRLLEDEVVILPCLPGAAPNFESAAPEPSASPAAGGAPLGNMVSGPTERAPASQADDQETTHEEGAREPLRGPGMGWKHPERKRARVDTIDHKAGDFRALLDGNSAQAALPREVSTRGSQ